MLCLQKSKEIKRGPREESEPAQASVLEAKNILHSQKVQVESVATGGEGKILLNFKTLLSLDSFKLSPLAEVSTHPPQERCMIRFLWE